ncbi:MAG TPA: hypothetical protein VHW25_12670 [Steroidobacteraceae bacterium]|jgi:hypothetical protein|nr:hypothetical protein [Steroidobacteraceae bacterium]
MSDRLTPTDSFRAKAWRDIRNRKDVTALSSNAHRLLAGIVHIVLNQHNNGAITLGPVTLGRLGITSRSNQVAGIKELIAAKLLTAATDGQSGRGTHYALSFLPLKVEPIQRINLSTGGQVNLSAGRQVPPEILSMGGQDLSTGGQVAAPTYKKFARVCAHAEESYEGENLKCTRH